MSSKNSRKIRETDRRRPLRDLELPTPPQQLRTRALRAAVRASEAIATVDPRSTAAGTDHPAAFLRRLFGDRLVLAATVLLVVSGVFAGLQGRAEVLAPSANELDSESLALLARELALDERLLQPLVRSRLARFHRGGPAPEVAALAAEFNLDSSFRGDR